MESWKVVINKNTKYVTVDASMEDFYLKYEKFNVPHIIKYMYQDNMGIPVKVYMLCTVNIFNEINNLSYPGTKLPELLKSIQEYRQGFPYNDVVYYEELLVKEIEKQRDDKIKMLLNG